MLDFNHKETRPHANYAQAALDRECELASGTAHGRNDQLNRSAFAIGQMVGAGWLDRVEAERRLYGAAEASGYVGKDGPAAARATIKSGLDNGEKEPRQTPKGNNGHAANFNDKPRSSRPDPKMAGVPLPAWTEPAADGTPKFCAIGRPEPPAFPTEVRRHVYLREGEPVRCKVKQSSDQQFVDWYRVVRPSDGATGWQAKKPVGYVPVPYVPAGCRDPFAPARRGEVIVWAEGEKDADAAWFHGFLAFTFGGTSDVLCGDLLTGHHVLVTIDHDEGGEKCGRKKIAAAIEGGAATVKVVRFPELAVGGDVSDFFEAGGTAEELLDRAETIDPAGSGTRGDETGKGKASRSAKAPPGPDKNDIRPVIQIRVGELAETVDAVEAAIIAAQLSVFQRGGILVSTGVAPVITSDRREIRSQQIIPLGDHALLEAAMAAAHFEKFDGRSGGMVPANCSIAIIKTLEQRSGRFRFPLLEGIVNAPTLRADGSILTEAGYDDRTALLLDPAGTTFPPIPDRPSKSEARAALGILQDLIVTFPFVGDADRSVALSAILTACVRRSLRTAPLHAFTAPVAGSGKSKLVDIASAIATGREAGVVAMGANPEELEKRLASLLLAGSSIAIDNVESQLGSDFLCQVLTQPTVRPRILGRSETPELPTNVLVTATGNNLVLVGDMTRRGLLSRLDPQVERPELRTFSFEPVAKVKADRGRYVVAALTVLRAYLAAGRPPQASVLGSFEEWSRLVRDALLWLGQADPVDTMEKARSSDPRLERLHAVMMQWKSIIGDDQVTASEAAQRASEKLGSSAFDFNAKTGFARPDFREALLAVAGAGGFIDTGKLGTWLGRNKNRVIDGHFFDCDMYRKGLTTWRLARMQSPEAAHSTQTYADRHAEAEAF